LRHDADGGERGRGVFDLDQMLDATWKCIIARRAIRSRVDDDGGLAAGLGIVAAVLGVVITMGALGGPPEEIGKKLRRHWWDVWDSFVLRTVGRGGAHGKMAEEEHAFLMVLRVTMIAFLKGVAPIMAVEIGRRRCRGMCVLRLRWWKQLAEARKTHRRGDSSRVFGRHFFGHYGSGRGGG